jgi:hypothetical protein
MESDSSTEQLDAGATISSDEPCLDFLLSSASRVVAVAGISPSSESTPVTAGVFDDDNGPFSKQKSSSSLSGVASMLSRRSNPGFTVCRGENSTNTPTLRDVRRVVFQTSSRGEKRIVSGLRAHTFTTQAFISSFAVGLAIGSIIAIMLKILSEVGYRLFPLQK